MAPERWTNDNQLNFLNEHLSAYCEHSRNNTLHLFWPAILSDWANKWPELCILIDNGDLPQDAKLPSADDPTDGTAFVWTDVYTEIYQDALYFRKKRIREWMGNNRRKALGLASMESSVPSLLAAGVGSRSRGHQLREVYQRMYKAKLDAAVEDELKKFPNPNPALLKGKKGKGKAQSDAVLPVTVIDPSAPLMTDKGYKLKLRQAVLKHMWDDEEEDVKELVQVERDKQNAARVLEAPTKGKMGLERDADNHQQSINTLAPKIAKLLQEVYELCGWSCLAIMVGPNPATGENLSAKTFSYAHNTAPSATFPNVYANFSDSYLTPYVEWLKTIYPKHLCGGKKNDPAPGPSVNNNPPKCFEGHMPPDTELEDHEEGLFRMECESDNGLEDFHISPLSPLLVPVANTAGTNASAERAQAPPPSTPSTVAGESFASLLHIGMVNSTTSADAGVNGQLQAPISGPAMPHNKHPGGPTEDISAAFSRMGQIHQPAEITPETLPMDPEISTTPINPPTSSTLPVDLLIDPLLCGEPPQPQDLQHQPYVVNHGSSGLLQTSGADSSASGSIPSGKRGHGGGRGRGRGHGHGRGHRQSNAGVYQGAAGGSADGEVGVEEMSEAQETAPAHSGATANTPEPPPSSHVTQHAVPLHAKHTDVRMLNDTWKAQSKENTAAKSKGKGKKGKPDLFNPDGSSPLVALSLLSVPPQNIATDCPQRERRAPKRFDDAFNLPKVTTNKRTVEALEEQGSGPVKKRARRK